MISIFNSNDKFFKNPTGAVEDSTKVHFKIKISRSLGCSGAFFSVRYDKRTSPSDFSMFWCGMAENDEYECWECDFTPEEVGLYWYRFILQTNQGRINIGRGLHGEGELRNDKVYQLTVFEKNFKTPNFLVGGIMYQIYPDRFAFSGNKKENIPTGRTIRENWDEQPEWRPNELGKITNTDFFCGDLKGIEEHLYRLKELGVTCLYLNPIFESQSNHRYDTADYSVIDPLLGDEKDFSSLCKKAKEMGIAVICDGVFSHTGDDSRYFNKLGRYDTLGAYNSQSSPYYNWYTFNQFPDKYNSWWGFETLPEVDENSYEFNKFINGKDGIVQKWIEKGSSGWRLDVADELPDEFLYNLRKAVKEKDEEAIIIGEVWEDASSKESYGSRRPYLLGNQLDSVMNYPYRDVVLGFLTGQKAWDMVEIILSIAENYPKQVLNILMNHIGTHDTERAITIIAGEQSYGRGREWQAYKFLSYDEKVRGIKLMKLASLIQYALPGVPCVYYGDEVGLEGYRDPFNRGTYPWGREDKELLDWYISLGKVRNENDSLKKGDVSPLLKGCNYNENILSFVRYDESLNSGLICVVNRSEETIEVQIQDQYQIKESVIAVNSNLLKDEKKVVLYPLSGTWIKIKK